MQQFRSAGVLARILIPFLLIAISGVAGRPHQLAEALHTEELLIIGRERERRSAILAGKRLVCVWH